MSDSLINILGLTLGWGLIALGALLILRALFADRSRGRRRCPRCWYSMDGVPSLQCPECGRTVMRERRLFKTRRRYRRTLASALLPLFGLAVFYTSGAVRLGWAKAIPSTILVSVAPIDIGDWYGSPLATPTNNFGYSFNLPGSLAPPASPPLWKGALADELLRRSRVDELADWQAVILAKRIRIAATAAGTSVATFDCRPFLSTKWMAASSLRRASNLSSNTPPRSPEHARMPDLVDHYLIEIAEVVPSRPPMNFLGTSMLTVSTDTRATYLGPVLLWWDSDTATEFISILQLIAAARPGAPATADAADWGLRTTALRRIESTQMRLGTERTLGEVLEAVALATGLSINIDWQRLWQGGVSPAFEVLDLPREATAGEILDAALICSRDLSLVLIRWSVSANAIEVDHLSVLGDHKRSLIHPILKVYDVRNLLNLRVRTAPDADVSSEEQSLLAEIRLAAEPDGTWMVPAFVFNGRLIVNAEFELHLAIEAHLAECAKHPDARIPP